VQIGLVGEYRTTRTGLADVVNLYLDGLLTCPVYRPRRKSRLTMTRRRPSFWSYRRTPARFLWKGRLFTSGQLLLASKIQIRTLKGQ
jgi:hypothetical protein